MEEIQQLLSTVRNKLRDVEELSKELHKLGVVLTINVASEKKTVEVPSASLLEISCKATINKEL